MSESKNRAIKLMVIPALACVYLLLSLDHVAATGTPFQADAIANHDTSATAPPSQPSQATAPCDPASAKTTLWGMTAAEAKCRSTGCIDCHQGIEDIHNSKVNLGCIDCHGGHAEVRLPAGAQKNSPEYKEAQRNAHIQPRLTDLWKTSANPQRAYAATNKESAEFIRFVNPGDLRVAAMSCGSSDCHTRDVHNVGKSMMTTGALLWGAALYNNGSFPLKNYRYGQAYGPNGEPLKLLNPEPVAPEDTKKHGILPFIEPLPRFPLSQPGNILRIFEKGGRPQLSLGLPNSSEPNGKPDRRLSERGLGTLNRTDP